MSILSRYIGARILVRFLLIALAAAAFALTVDLVDTADRILRDHGGEHAAVLRYAALRMPGLIADMTPIAALLAALLALGDLLRHRELVATWDMGVSPTGLAVKLLPLGLALGAAQAALNEAVVPWAARELVAMGFRDERQGLLAASAEGPLWLRREHDIVRVDVGGGGDGIGPVSVFRLGDDGLLVERIEARRLEAVAADDGWRLEGVVRYRVTPAAVERLEALAWPAALVDPRSLALLAADARTLPLTDLLRVLALGDTASRPTSLYLTWAIYRTVAPLQPLLMIALAVALARRFERGGGLAWLLVTGAAIGFSYFILDRAAVALAEVGALPAWLGATGASVALGALIARLLREPRRRRAVA